MKGNDMTNAARGQAAAQLASIRDMVAALNCDYGRFEELREMRADLLTPEDAAELAELEEQAGDCDNEDDARQRIEEDALSVEIRAGWALVGEEFEPDEYRIVLCTGGPHVEIVGDLNRHREAATAWLYYSDWFKGKQEYHVANDDEAALLAYASVFYFGD